jgi:hypothetical protein
MMNHSVVPPLPGIAGMIFIGFNCLPAIESAIGFLSVKVNIELNSMFKNFRVVGRKVLKDEID